MRLKPLLRARAFGYKRSPNAGGVRIRSGKGVFRLGAHYNGGMVTVYRWRIKDKRTGRWRVLRWSMTEQNAIDWARKDGVEIKRVEGSREDRTDVDGRH